MSDDKLIIRDGEADTASIAEYENSRRDLVRRGLTASGLAVAAASIPTLLGVRNAFAQATDDASIVTGAVGLEQTAVFAYTAAAGTGKLDAASKAVALHFRDQEQEHVDALTTALKSLGGTAPPKPTSVDDVKGLAAAAGSADGIVKFAIALEEMAVAAYYDAHQKLKDAKLLQAGASIMANEGQHLVILRTVAKQNPVPNAFETGQASK